jgi:nucleoside phosphorylase
MARRRHEDYTVGWVCALPVELAAAQEMLDEMHPDLTTRAGENNIYTVGRIGKHNVVIGCLPEGQMGTSPAAAAAARMQSNFPSIRVGLMVGIGGGVPSSTSDIRLGDVVVSKAENNHGGVVQYDFGKSTPSGFERKGFLNAPPKILQNAVSQLRAKHMRGSIEFLEYVSKLDHLPAFTRAKAGRDVLFDSQYNHQGGSTCEACDKQKIVERPLRGNQASMVHYGTIASGNQVMRDATERDRVSSDLGGVLCFEMEAAGLMNEFPCLVIRGICDYSDSHKNKSWQPYAAGVAAAYAKELLSIIPAIEVGKSLGAQPTGQFIVNTREAAINIYYRCQSTF